MPILTKAVPVLRVADVGRSIAWYSAHLGLNADPFPAEPPFVFAILFGGEAEIMLRQAPNHLLDRTRVGWDVYLHVIGLKELYPQLVAAGLVTRPLQRMPYGQCECDIVDPDGWRLCLGEPLDDTAIPAAPTD